MEIELYHFSFGTNIFIVTELALILLIIYAIRKGYIFKIAKKIKISGLLIIIFILTALTIGNVNNILQRLYVMNTYLNKEYSVVEGEVRDFIPGAFNGRSYESFYIKDIYFQYNQNDNICGYNRVKDKGGVIKGNGQDLVIYYVYVPFGLNENRIVNIKQKNDYDTGSG